MKALKLIAIAGLSILPLATAQVQAAENRVAVRFYSQELTSERGVAKLYGRIVSAAKNACGERETVGSRLISPDWQRCVRDAVSLAVSKVDSRPLYAYYEKQIQRPQA
jgi:UrcA family protein